MIRFVAVLALFLAGCSTPNAVTFPRAPDWQQPTDARPITGIQVRAAIAALAPAADVTLSDDTYTLVSYDWLVKYMAWTWEAAKAVDLHYTPESFDCENFASLFCDIAAKKAAEAHVQAAPLAGTVVLSDGAGRHAMVGVATDRGLFIVEPQPDAGPFRIKSAADYKDRILGVSLGYNPR